jgi:hypothetical protein
LSFMIWMEGRIFSSEMHSDCRGTIQHIGILSEHSLLLHFTPCCRIQPSEIRLVDGWLCM